MFRKREPKIIPKTQLTFDNEHQVKGAKMMLEAILMHAAKQNSNYMTMETIGNLLEMLEEV